MSSPQNIAVPASRYSYDDLAEIYNQTRIDYIVPMPMNGKRTKQYVDHYDVDLDRSIVATTETGKPLGIAMLGLRGNRAWITRLGVTPHQRERRVGTFMMNCLLDNARKAGADHVQLEVIVGNEPAYQMFVKFGFTPVRELLVVRRPPKPHVEGTHPLVHELRELTHDEIIHCLHNREPGASWVEETASLLNAGDLHGIKVRMGDSEGWAVFHAPRFQLQHIVLWAGQQHYNEISFALLYYTHELFPNRDTKVENIPTDHPSWRAFHTLGYVIEFKRIEMTREL